MLAHDRHDPREAAVGPLAVLEVDRVDDGPAAEALEAAAARTADVERIDGLDAILADVPGDDAEYPAENYLLVGSDSREGIVAGSDDYAYVGDADMVGGRRSDTIMILRQERNGGAALMSPPRDLWVEIYALRELGYARLMEQARVVPRPFIDLPRRRATPPGAF